mmetsp:Transcript_5121/g.9668  ORF Transcript_5121/g.9668 Transcript_5121/m.9668 type:complete len:203 (+) Transcript_5121:736-1344(+)
MSRSNTSAERLERIASGSPARESWIELTDASAVAAALMTGMTDSLRMHLRRSRSHTCRRAVHVTAMSLQGAAAARKATGESMTTGGVTRLPAALHATSPPPIRASAAKCAVPAARVAGLPTWSFQSVVRPRRQHTTQLPLLSDGVAPATASRLVPSRVTASLSPSGDAPPPNNLHAILAAARGACRRSAGAPSRAGCRATGA